MDSSGLGTEAAIRIAFSQSEPQERRREAEEFLNQIKQTQGWEISKSFLKNDCQDQYTLFWAFSVLVEQARDKVGGDSQFGDFLFQYLRLIAKRDLNKFLRNKFAQLIAVTFSCEYPQRWTNFWPSFFELLKEGETVIDIYLSVLITIDELVVNVDTAPVSSSSHRDRATQIKDAMREGSVETMACVWYNIIGMYHTQKPLLASQALVAVQLYIEWIDINLVTTDEWIRMFYQLLMNEALRCEASECISELVMKRMREPLAKVEHLKKIQVVDVLPLVVQTLASTPIVIENDTETSFPVKVGQLCSNVGLELLNCIENAQLNNQDPQPAFVLIHRFLPCLLRVFSIDCIQVSISVLEAIHQYLSKVKRDTWMQGQAAPYLEELYRIIYERIHLPVTKSKFDVENPEGDNEKEILEYRKVVLVLFKILFQQSLGIGKMFVGSLSGVLSGSGPWSSCEAFLQLVYTMGEGVRQEHMKEHQDHFSQLIQNILASDICNHEHPAVRLAFFEVIERYAGLFNLFPERIPDVLVIFLDKRGVQSSSEIVSSRASSLFVRFISHLKQKIAPYAEGLFVALQPVLAKCTHEDVIGDDGISIDDQQKLYEALGVIICAEQVTTSKGKEYLQGLLSPLIENMRKIIQCGELAKGGKSALMASGVIANEISFIHAASKGLPVSVTPKEITMSFVPYVKEIIEILPSCTSFPLIRDKMMLLQHRIIDIFGESSAEVICTCTSTLLQTSTSLGDMCRVLRVPTQLMKKMRGKSVVHVTNIFADITSKVFCVCKLESIHASSSVISEEARQNMELLRVYLELLMVIFTHDCAPVLSAEKNAPFFQDVLLFVRAASLLPPRVQVSRICIQVLRKSVEFFHNTPGFDRFILEHILPSTIEVVLKPEFFPNDANCLTTLNEVSSFHFQLLKLNGNDCLSVLLSAFSQLVDQNAVEKVAVVLQSANETRYSDCLKALHEHKFGKR